MTQLVPHIRQDVSVRGGPMTLPWYAWAQRIDDAVSSGALTADGAAAAIKAMALALGSPDGSVEGIPPLRSAGVVVGSGSVRHAGSLADGLVTLGLDGDVDAPPSTAYYGTDAAGAKSFHPVADAFTPGVGVALTTDPATGVTDVALAELVDTGTGAALVKVTRDAYGRIEGTTPATTTDLPEGTNLYYTPERADARVAAGIAALKTEVDPFPVYTTAAEATALADAKVIDSIADGDTTHAPSRNAVFDALAAKAAIPTGYIDGLTLQWVSGTALTVSSGAAYIPASGNIVSAPAAIAKTGLSLAASTWYHVYLYLNAGVPEIEVVTASPATYSGTALSKTADPSRRYLGSVLTDSSGGIYPFQQSGTVVRYLTDCGDAPFRIIAGGAATTFTAVSASAVVPSSSRMATIFVNNISPTLGMEIGVTGRITTVNPTACATFVFPISSTQTMVYRMTNVSASAYIDVLGYAYER